MNLKNLICKWGFHNWVVEQFYIARDLKFPAFRICQNCGKFQQPGISTLTVNWCEADTVSEQVLKSKIKIEKNLLSNGKKKSEKN